jgi:hypothetical protein
LCGVPAWVLASSRARRRWAAPGQLARVVADGRASAPICRSESLSASPAHTTSTGNGYVAHSRGQALPAVHHETGTARGPQLPMNGLRGPLGTNATTVHTVEMAPRAYRRDIVVSIAAARRTELTREQLYSDDDR